MIEIAKKDKNFSPLVKRVSRVLFGALLSVILLIAAFQILILYKRSESRQLEEIAKLRESVEPSLINALWMMDKVQIKAILSGIIANRAFVGVSLHDTLGKFNHNIGQISEDAGSYVNVYDNNGQKSCTEPIPFFVRYTRHTDDLYFENQNERIKIGQIVIYTNNIQILREIEQNVLAGLLNMLLPIFVFWIFFSYYLNRTLITPIKKLVDGINKIELKNIGEQKIDIESNLYDELKILGEQFNGLLSTLKYEIEQKEAAQEKQRKDELEKYIHEQAKFAQMSEMLTSISHHWRQPLNMVALGIQNIKDAYEYGELNEELLSKQVANLLKVVQNMSETINTFRSFAGTKEKKSVFNIKDKLKKFTEIVTPELETHFIRLQVTLEENLFAYGDTRYLYNALQFIVSNAQEKLLERKGTRELCLTLLGTENGSLITLQDNGGGIKLEILDRIFEPFFTTKEKSYTTGNGLYFAKMMVEQNLNGRISVENISGGARFSIFLPEPENPEDTKV